MVITIQQHLIKGSFWGNVLDVLILESNQITFIGLVSSKNTVDDQGYYKNVTRIWYHRLEQVLEKILWVGLEGSFRKQTLLSCVHSRLEYFHRRGFFSSNGLLERWKLVVDVGCYTAVGESCKHGCEAQNGCGQIKLLPRESWEGLRHFECTGSKF